MSELGKPMGPKGHPDKYEWIESNLAAANQIVEEQRYQIAELETEVDELESQLLDKSAEIFNLKADLSEVHQKLDGVETKYMVAEADRLKLRANFMVKLFNL